MGLNIRATASNGETVETPVSHFDLIKATYGIGDTVKVSHVINVMFSLIVAGIAFGISITTEDTTARLIFLALALQPVGYFIAGTARTRHMTKTLVQVMGDSPLPMLTVLTASYATAFAAAALCVTGGAYGIAGGVALILANPVVRYAGDIGFALRIWNAKRLERKMSKACEAGKREGLGD